MSKTKTMSEKNPQSPKKEDVSVQSWQEVIPGTVCAPALSKIWHSEGSIHIWSLSSMFKNIIFEMNKWKNHWFTFLISWVLIKYFLGLSKLFKWLRTNQNLAKCCCCLSVMLNGWGNNAVCHYRASVIFGQVAVAPTLGKKRIILSFAQKI